MRCASLESINCKPFDLVKGDEVGDCSNHKRSASRIRYLS